MKIHPELKKGEVFLANEPPEIIPNIGWKTKRVGERAYDREGNLVIGLRPVFVQKSELDKAGIKLTKIE